MEESECLRAALVCACARLRVGAVAVHYYTHTHTHTYTHHSSNSSSSHGGRVRETDRGRERARDQPDTNSPHFAGAPSMERGREGRKGAGRGAEVKGIYLGKGGFGGWRDQ